MDADVLVVGLGPVGGLLALLLGELGVSVLAVDRASAPWPLPRAAVLDDEALRALGPALAAAVLADGVAHERVDLRLARGDAVTLMRAPARTLAGQPALAGVQQPLLEARVAAAAARLPGIALRRATELRGLAQDAHGVRAQVHGPDGARELRARWLVGCDGAHSAVRRLAGAAFRGRSSPQRWLVLDARVEDPGPAVVEFLGDPLRPGVTLPLGSGVRRWEFMARPGDDASLAAALTARAGLEVVRSAVYVFHTRVARPWRTGRVLLAGDAAHVMPPFAGQGLGAGLRDARNLAWKLAAVLRGADAALLDTYEAERAPHVRAMAAYARFVGALVQTRRPRVAAARDAALRALAATPALGPWLQGARLEPGPRLARGPLTRLPHGGEPVPDAGGLDAAAGPGWALVARDPRAAAAVGALPGVATLVLGRDLTDADGELEAWLGARRAGVVAVRPDRFALGAVPADGARALTAAVAALAAPA